jgi:cyanophycin synthetase
MEFGRIWALRGPNVWTRCPVLEAELTLGGRSRHEPSELPILGDHPAAWLLGPDGERAWRAGPAHAVQHAALEFQRRAGSPVTFGLTRAEPSAGSYRLVVEYEEESLGRAALDAALRLVRAALGAEPFDAPAEVARLRELAHDVRLGPSTAAIVRAARRRGIPARRLNDGSLVVLGQGARQRRICTAETDATGAIAEAIAQDKQLTRFLLKSVGVPVPEGRPVADADDAWQAAQELGLPVVVKPQFGNHGRGVAPNLTTREQVARAYAAAREEGEHVLVETFAPGADYRLLVIGNRLVAAALREPAHVVGDGRSTVQQLIEVVNRDPRRSDGHATVLSFIKLDPVALAVLGEQGYAPESVPPAGVRVLIRRNGNLSTGGTATDVTDRVHPEVAARAVDAARAVGLDIAGVDVVALDIGRPLEPQRGAVVEVNAGPGLRMHLEPSTGEPRPVGEAIVEMLFPLVSGGVVSGERPGPLTTYHSPLTTHHAGRIPIVAVTGVNGKTTTTRLLAHLLRTAGKVVGMTCTDGTYLDGRRTEARDCSGPRSARAVLLNPRVEAAVFETARGGILREGLGFDHCNVAVVTNIGGGDHLGLRGIETPDELARVKRVVVEAVDPQGAAVLNAADPLVPVMAAHCPGGVVFFGRDAAHPTLTAHRRTGGRAVFVRDRAIVLADGEREETLPPLARVPLTHGGRVAFQVENVLAAAAAGWALRLPVATIAAGLESFTGDPRQVPARFNVLPFRGATVIVDYAHNPSALAALVDAVLACSAEQAGAGDTPVRRRSVVYAACNRRDEDVLQMGEILARGFDRFLLYADRGNRDRADGELNALLRRGIMAQNPAAEILEVDGELAAIELALGTVAPGDLVVLGVESIDEALAFVRSRLESPEHAAAPVTRALDHAL